MKRAYWLILLFAAWCVVCALWYMFAVKGISNDPNYFSPHPRLMAIVEVLLMLMIACLIGYAIGWALGEGPVQSLREAVQQLEMDKEDLIRVKRDTEGQLKWSRQGLAEAQRIHGENELKAKQSIDSLNVELEDIRKELANVKTAAIAQPAQPRLDQLENEAGALRFRAKQLEFQNKDLEETIQKLKHEYEQNLIHARKPPVEPVHPFIRPVEIDEKDDLTVIKGIGPFIEKRLNMIGVYTLRQISEFTPDMIEHVANAIEFFPNRIFRDDWVGQARKLSE